MIDISYTLANGWMFLDMASWETHAYKATHTLWISSDRVMCVHTLPRGKTLSSTSACNRSSSEGKGRQEEEKFTNRKGKRNMLTLMPVLFQQGGLCLLLHSVADSRLLQAARSVEKSEERFCLWIDQQRITVEPPLSSTHILLSLSGCHISIVVPMTVPLLLPQVDVLDRLGGGP